MKGLRTLVIGLSCLLTVWLLAMLLTFSGVRTASEKQSWRMLDKLEQYLTMQTGAAMTGISGVEQTFWLNDEDLIAPVPDPEGFGETEDPASLGWLLEKAAPLLEDQPALFSTETVIKEGSTVRYYLDKSIFALTWKEVIDDAVYTFSEIKVAHPSQIRRFFAGGQYGAGTQYTTTEMAKCVNAVVASSGDYYEYRYIGVVVNNGQVYRTKGELLDTCYIDDHGDLLVTKAGEVTGEKAVQEYVRENNVRFTLSFGPIMIWDGEVCVPGNYNSGEINDEYPRAALCQLGQLHYAVVAVNMEDSHISLPSVRKVAQRLWERGVTRAYALDGGQTATIVMDNTLINQVSYGSQREISDILYFATAVPNG